MYWNSWYAGWGWFLWFGVVILCFSSLGNWNYTYRAHRRFLNGSFKDALDILDERFARGDINESEYLKVKAHLSPFKTQSRQPVGSETAKKAANQGAL